MSLNNITTTIPSVEKLVQRVMAAERAQQKDIRLSIQEAHELAAELAVVSTKLGKTISEIHAMLSEIKNSGGTSESLGASFDGGTF